MTAKSFWWRTKNLRLSPRQGLRIEYVQVLEMFVSRVASKQIQLVSQDRHGVSVASQRYHPVYLWLDPSNCVQVQNFNVVEALVSVVASKHVESTSHSRHSVACSC